MQKKDTVHPRKLNRYKKTGLKNHIFLLRKFSTEKEFAQDFKILIQGLVKTHDYKNTLSRLDPRYINILSQLDSRGENGYVDLENKYFDLAIETVLKREDIEKNQFYKTITEFCQKNWLGQEWVKSLAILLTCNRFHPPVKSFDIQPTQKNLKNAKRVFFHETLAKLVYIDVDNYEQVEKSVYETSIYNQHKNKSIKELGKAIFKYRKNLAEDSRKLKSGVKKPKFKNSISDEELLKRALKLTPEQAKKEADSYRHIKNRQKLKI